MPGPSRAARSGAADGEVDVAIVGAGPVGLALAGALALRGVRVALFEARDRPHTHSRAIGIHPTALEALEPLGVVPALRAEGREVRRGHAYAAGSGAARRLGTLDFGVCPPPYRFVLTLPQHRTEAHLEARLADLAPGALRRAHRVTGVEVGPHGVALDVATPGGPLRWRAAAAVDCGGRDGPLRSALGIATNHHDYHDRFVMGDFADPWPGAQHDAGIYLTPQGVVEAFPLPGGVRRWVLAVDERRDDPDAGWIAAEVARRTGVTLDPASCTMRSAFGVERRLAERFARGRVALCGDAAHVCSPIGGQGMNLGWLDAAALLAPLERAARDPAATRPFDAWARHRRRAARSAILRAEANMTLGRPWRWPGAQRARALLVGAALRRPLADGAARLFTMRGLV